MGYNIQQSSTAYSLVFFMKDATDHLSGKTGLSPTVTLAKNAGAFAAPAGAVSEIGSGWYKVAGNATDSNTLGPLLLHATAGGADATDEIYPVEAGVNVTAIAGDTNAPTHLKRAVLGTVIGTVGIGSTTTSIVTSSLTPAAIADDQFNGRVLVFDRGTTTTELRGQATDISASTAAGILTVTELTTAPVAGDTFTLQ